MERHIGDLDFPEVRLMALSGSTFQPEDGSFGSTDFGSSQEADVHFDFDFDDQVEEDEELGEDEEDEEEDDGPEFLFDEDEDDEDY